MKLYELMDFWLENYVKDYKSEKTYLCYKDCVTRIKKHSTLLAEEDLANLRELHFRDFFNSMSNVYSKSTLNHIRTTIYKSFDLALRNGFINSLPMLKLEIPKNASEKVVEALTKRQQDKIEEIAENDMLGHIVIFLLRTGLRVGEMLNLKWEDYNYKNNTIKVTKSKTSAGLREIPLSNGARFIIEYCRKNNKSDYIFLNSKGNKLTYSSVKKLFARIKKESYIYNFTPHVCRHSFATRMVERGVNIKALSVMLGHTNTSFTIQRYVTADINFLKEQICLMDD